jgi:hypothetical protein
LVSLSDMMRCSSSVEPSVMLWDWGSTGSGMARGTSLGIGGTLWCISLTGCTWVCVHVHIHVEGKRKDWCKTRHTRDCTSKVAIEDALLLTKGVYVHVCTYNMYVQHTYMYAPGHPMWLGSPPYQWPPLKCVPVAVVLTHTLCSHPLHPSGHPTNTVH